MTGASAPSEYGSWSAPGHARAIQYSLPVLNQIGKAAVDGFYQMRHGGIEVGGVLFGTHEDDIVRILDFRPLLCSYANGPSFVLSEEDQLALGRLLEAAQNDSKLGGLKAVGWYHSHTRSEIFLSEHDLEIFNRFFPENWQIAMVLRPAHLEPTRVGLFFRESDGSIQSESSYSEFLITAPQPAQRSPEPPIASSAATSMASAEPPRRPRVKWYWAGMSAIAAACVAVSLWMSKPDSRVLLKALNEGGQLRIEWNRTAAPIRAAQSASLEILDGAEKTSVSLEPEELRTGAVAYARRTHEVTVRLRLRGPGGKAIEETTRFVGSPEGKNSKSPAADLEKGQLEREAETMRARLQQQTAELSRREQMVTKLKSESRVGAPAASGDRPHGQVAQAPVLAKLPLRKPVPQPAPELPKPVPLTAVAESPAHFTSQLPPLLTAPASSSKQATTLPAASGNLIWTGRVKKNGIIIIEGSHASIGSLAGSLPGAPITLRLFPGSLTSEGITVYTAQHWPGQSETAPPSVRNGWNRTLYIWDPQRAGQLKILEAPSRENGWNRLVLRNQNPKLSIILMEWRQR